MSKKLITAFLVFTVLIISLGLIFSNDIKWLIQYSIYSNDFHSINCDKMPSYETLKSLFEKEKLPLLKNIEDIESGYSSESKEKRDYFANNQTIKGNYITISLKKSCNDSKGEIEVTVTSNDFVSKLKESLNSKLNNPPINFIND
jgi:hypothetical protein